jgi:outer membrane protein
VSDPALKKLVALGLWAVALCPMLYPLLCPMAATAQTQPAPGGSQVIPPGGSQLPPGATQTPPGTIQTLPGTPQTPPAAPAPSTPLGPVTQPPLIITPPGAAERPPLGTTDIPGLAPSTIPIREMLPPPPGIRPFPTPDELKGKEIGVDEAIKIAIDNQPLILARIGDYQATIQNIYIALAPQLPQLSGQWNGFEQKTVSSVQSPSGQLVPPSLTRNVTVSATSLSTTATVTASQLLWDFGKTLAAVAAARAGAKSSAEDVEIQKDETVRLVKEAYFTLLLNERLVSVNQAALERALVNLRSARGFFDVGTQPKSTVTRAEVDVATAQVNLIGALNAVVISRTTLNTLMGIPINTPTRIKDLLAYQHVDFDPKTLLPEAFARRPEYRQIKARFEQADETVKVQFRNFFPSVTASGTYGSARADMNEIYNYGVQLNWTIFDGGGKVALYKQARAQRDAAQARVRDTELNIWTQVEQAYNTVVQSEEAIGSATKAVESADENFRLSQGRFDAGVANIIELTDAQLSLTNAQAGLAQTLATYRISLARLERFLGRR